MSEGEGGREEGSFAKYSSPTSLIDSELTEEVQITEGDKGKSECVRISV